MANRDIRTNVVISAETKGFESAQQKTVKFNDEMEKGVAAQAAGYEEVSKGITASDKALDKLKKSFGDSSKEMGKHIDSVVKQFKAIDQTDFKDVQKQIRGLESDLSNFAKEQLAVTSAMSEMEDKAGPAYKELEERLKAVNKESRATEDRIRSLTKAFSEQAKEAERAARVAEQKRGAFVQGMAQAGFAIPGIGLQRGPGMGRQMAGMAVGMGLRGIGRGLGAGGAMFGGVGGMAQAISGIPYVGPALAGQFSMAAGFAQQNLQWQRQRLDISPYIEDIPTMISRDERRRAAIRANRRAKVKMSEWDVGFQRYDVTSEMANEFRQAINEQRYREGVSKRVPQSRLLESIEGGQFEGTDDEITRRFNLRRMLIDKRTGELLSSEKMLAKYRQIQGTEKAQRDVHRGLNKSAQDAEKLAEGARRRIPTSPYSTIGTLGMELMGVAQPEAAQMAGMLTKTGGGGFREAQRQGFLSQAFAARTLFGIDPTTSGAFLQAGRRGGMVGARGEGGKALRDALSEGLKLGLEGSELNMWMQQTAQGIQQWQQTGIEINPQSISAMAKDIGESGIAATRATAIARGFTGGLQQIGTRGAQSGLDLAMLQIFGGFQGGGVGQYRRSRERLETMATQLRGQGAGAIAESGYGEQFRQIMRVAGSDPDAQAEFLQRVLRNIGANISTKESSWLARRFQGLESTPEQLRAIQEEQARAERGQETLAAIEGAGGLRGAAARRISLEGPNLRAQASIQNQQIQAGRKMIGIVQGLERASMDVNKAFRNLSSDTLVSFTKGIEAAASKASELAATLSTEGLGGIMPNITLGGAF